MRRKRIMMWTLQIMITTILQDALDLSRLAEKNGELGTNNILQDALEQSQMTEKNETGNTASSASSAMLGRAVTISYRVRAQSSTRSSSSSNAAGSSSSPSQIHALMLSCSHALMLSCSHALMTVYPRLAQRRAADGWLRRCRRHGSN